MSWFMTLVDMLFGAAVGTGCYIRWCSRETYSEHSKENASNSVHAVLSRVRWERLAERDGYIDHDRNL